MTLGGWARLDSVSVKCLLLLIPLLLMTRIAMTRSAMLSLKASALPVGRQLVLLVRVALLSAVKWVAIAFLIGWSSAVAKSTGSPLVPFLGREVGVRPSMVELPLATAFRVRVAIMSLVEGPSTVIAKALEGLMTRLPRTAILTLKSFVLVGTAMAFVSTVMQLVFVAVALPVALMASATGIPVVGATAIGKATARSFVLFLVTAVPLTVTPRVEVSGVSVIVVAVVRMCYD